MSARKTDGGRREDNRAEQRAKVLDAAAALFASKGYGGTGMREIAREAGVSLSMINYYFGSKQGVLEELLDDHHDRYLSAVATALESAETVEGKVRAWIRAAVTLARALGPTMRVGFIDLPREAPGVLDLKANRIREVVTLMAAHIFGPLERLAEIHMLGPALGSMVMSHFMVRPMMERVVGELPDDDAFFERYAEVIADQVLYGLVGRPPDGERPVGRTPELTFRPGLRPGGLRRDDRG